MEKIGLKNGQALIIRKANKEDALSMIDYIEKISTESDFLTFGKGEFKTSVEREQEIIASHSGAENKLFIVAEIEGEIVGNLNFSGGHRSRTKHAGEFGVSVAKDYWGLGIGKELIGYLIDWATKGNVVKKINLRVREDNQRGISLYTRLGFKNEGVISRDFYVNGQYYSSICMGLELE